MRCLAIANALAERGLRCRFLLPGGGEVFVPLVLARGHEVEVLSGPLHRHASALSSRLPDPVDLAIIDDYESTPAFEAELHARSRRLVVVDDFAHRRHRCDVLLAPGATAEEGESSPAGEGPRYLLCGPRHAPLRQEFAALRPRALRRRMAGGEVRRVLVTIGLTDPAGLSAPVTEALLGLPFDLEVDIAVGAAAPGLSALRRLAEEPRVRLHVDTDEMATLMCEADLAIGAGGSSSFERCCLGLPTLAYLIAENQHGILRDLERRGALLRMGEAARFDARELAAAVRALIRDGERRKRMAAAAAAVCDGRGVERLLTLLMTKGTAAELQLRPVREEDCDRLYDWRNDPHARRMAIRREAIDYFDHRRWFAEASADPDRILRIAEVDGLPVGSVRADRRREGWVLSWTVAPEARSRGFGKRMVHGFAVGLSGPVVAYIREENAASKRIAAAAGLRLTGIREGIETWIRDGSPGV